MSENDVELIDSGDVYIEDFHAPDCDNCTKLMATRKVFMNIRHLGQSVVIGLFCEKCAPMMAERVKAALPKEEQP